MRVSAVSAARAIVGLVGTLVLAACGPGLAAENDDVATIGFLRVVASGHYDVFADELRRHGWHSGRVRVLPEDPDELYRTVDEARAALHAWQDDGIDLVIAFSTPYAHLVQDETDLPGLFVVNDPVAGGLMADLSKPDGQLTGVTWGVPADRTLDLASRALGGLSRIGYLQPTDDPAVAGHRAAALEAADGLGIEVVEAHFAGGDDVARAVGELAAAEVEAVYLSSANATAAAVGELEEQLDRHRLPAIANVTFVDFAVVTLAPHSAELHRQLARQAARLLDGATVATVPGEAPRRFTLTIDRTRAEALDRSVSPEVIRQADVVR